MQTYTTQEVTCIKCYRIVHINPDRVRCEHCDANLQALISPDLARSYFYGRACQFFDRGDAKLALAEANRGLKQVEDSELRLLAAILARHFGDLDQMRAHVAAIAIDDRLRKEAEWLLRSQYSPERRRERIASLTPATALAETRQAEPKRPTYTLRNTVFKLALGLLVTCSLVVLAWNIWRQGPFIAINIPVTPIPNASPIPNATQTPEATPTNSETITEGVVQLADGALAASSPESIVAGSQPFDLASALNAAGRGELAALPVEARQKDGLIILNGTVTMMAERAALIEFAQSVAGTTEVNAIGLQVRTPATYTVQTGDTLWLISFKFYGDDSQRIPQIFEVNRDVMNSANDLRVGMELKLPAFE